MLSSNVDNVNLKHERKTKRILRLKFEIYENVHKHYCRCCEGKQHVLYVGYRLDK